jgi:hypothetical protein
MTIRALRMMMPRVFFKAFKIHLHIGWPRALFFLLSSILASSSSLAPGPSERHAPWCHEHPWPTTELSRKLWNFIAMVRNRQMTKKPSSMMRLSP